MKQTYVQRLRVIFRKVGPTRYISHLDVARTWERILNRAKLPVDYSHGFNRRPKIQFATATALGTTSDCEVIDIWFREEVVPDEARIKIEESLAPGIELRSLVQVSLSEPSLQAMTRETSFVATIREGIGAADFETAVQNMLDADQILRERKAKKGKVKEYDLRTLIFDLKTGRTADDALLLTMRLVLEPGKTGRPDEVLKTIGLDPLDVRIHRTEIVLDDGKGVRYQY